MIRIVHHATFTVERRYNASPSRVFNAFADPESHARWFVKGEGFEIAEFAADFRVGGHETGTFAQKKEGPVFTNNTWYLDIIPDTRIAFAYTMSMLGAPFSASLATIEIHLDETGARLVFTEQAAFFENADGPEMRKAGWSTLLDSLGRELGASSS